MPYYYFIEIWTPLKLIGIRVYQDEDKGIWIKVWNSRKRRIRM